MVNHMGLFLVHVIEMQKVLPAGFRYAKNGVRFGEDVAFSADIGFGGAEKVAVTNDAKARCRCTR